MLIVAGVAAAHHNPRLGPVLMEEVLVADRAKGPLIVEIATAIVMAIVMAGPASRRRPLQHDLDVLPVALVVVHPFVEGIVEPVLQGDQPAVAVPPEGVHVLGGRVGGTGGVHHSRAVDRSKTLPPAGQLARRGQAIIAGGVQVVTNVPPVAQPCR
jgi:hypothetical protein